MGLDRALGDAGVGRDLPVGQAGPQLGAQVCGVGDRKGRIAPGYDADLLEVAGDPVADLGALLAPVAVLLAGELVAGTVAAGAR